MSGASLHEEIHGLVARMAPVDAVEDGHRRQALAWLDSTSDVSRRVKPGRPSPHLVSYFLLIDHGQGVSTSYLHQSKRLVREGYWVNEVSFWRPDPEDRSKINRAGRVQDVEPGLSEFPHVIVNQARMLAYPSAKPQGQFGHHVCDLYQAFEANTAINTHAVEHIDKIFRCDVPGRAGREWTSTQASN